MKKHFFILLTLTGLPLQAATTLTEKAPLEKQNAMVASDVEAFNLRLPTAWKKKTSPTVLDSEDKVKIKINPMKDLKNENSLSIEGSDSEEKEEFEIVTQTLDNDKPVSNKTNAKIATLSKDKDDEDQWEYVTQTPTPTQSPNKTVSRWEDEDWTILGDEPVETNPSTVQEKKPGLLGTVAKGLKKSTEKVYGTAEKVASKVSSWFGW